MKILRGLYRGLEALYGLDSGIDPVHHLISFSSAEGCGRERLVVAQDGEDVAVGLALDEALLAWLESCSPAGALAEDALGDALPVVEGLSHLLYVAEAARRERPISGLELETQAEVDKLAVCVLHHWPRATDAYARLVDRLFYRFTLARDLDPEMRWRYTTANRLALGFVRRLEGDVTAGRWSRLRARLRHFWGADMGAKRALAGL
ncbi:MAG: hypothetical protein KC636_18395 [Myxococcales bacterium]|nr:hypothetical protein [Myxococcales bacterium]